MLINVYSLQDKDVDMTQDVNPDWIETNLSEEVLKNSDKLPENLKDVVDDEVSVKFM